MANKKLNITALVLLLGFIFNFAHSELDFLTPEGDIGHHAHDYCQLTNAPSAKQAETGKILIQKNLHPQIAPDCLLPASTAGSAALSSAGIEDQFCRRCLPHIPLFVINRTLLI